MLSSVIASHNSRSQQGDGEHGHHAENDGGYPGRFDFGKPSPV
jgi:hypothetical protein